MPPAVALLLFVPPLTLATLVGGTVVRHSRHCLDRDARMTEPVRPQTARPAQSACHQATVAATPA